MSKYLDGVIDGVRFECVVGREMSAYIQKVTAGIKKARAASDPAIKAQMAQELDDYDVTATTTIMGIAMEFTVTMSGSTCQRDRFSCT